MLPISDPMIAIIVICGLFYFILESINFVCYFLFQKEKFMSWWTDTPVQEDYTHMYNPTYNYRGFVVRLTLNMRWVYHNPKSCMYRGDKK